MHMWGSHVLPTHDPSRAYDLEPHGHMTPPPPHMIKCINTQGVGVGRRGRGGGGGGRQTHFKHLEYEAIGHFIVRPVEVLPK